MGWTDRAQLGGTGWTELGEHSGCLRTKKGHRQSKAGMASREGKGGSGAKTGQSKGKKNQVKYQAAFPH